MVSPRRRPHNLEILHSASEVFRDVALRESNFGISWVSFAISEHNPQTICEYLEIFRQDRGLS